MKGIWYFTARQRKQIKMSDQTYTEEICEGCGDSLDICESSSHTCYKCDGGCGKVMGSNDNCIRICEDCK